jgi:hypothetical protein
MKVSLPPHQGKQARLFNLSFSHPQRNHFIMRNLSPVGNKKNAGFPVLKEKLPKFISRAAAARELRVSVNILDRIVQTQKIQTFQIPGYSRKWIDRAAIEKLTADAFGNPGRTSITA